MTESSDLFDELDRLWAETGCADLPLLLSQAPKSDAWTRAELCAADLEWRWRRHQAPGSESEKEFCESIPQRPNASDYERFLVESWDDDQTRCTLLEAEWGARCVWGDGPDLDEFSKLRSDCPKWSGVLSRQLYSLLPLEAVLDGRQLRRPLTVRLSRDVVLGRQKIGEPKAPSYIEASGRLIIASSHFRSISREQLRLRRTRRNEVELTNVSKSTKGKFGSFELGPSESTRTELPLNLVVGELNMIVDHVANFRTGDSDLFDGVES